MDNVPVRVNNGASDGRNSGHAAKHSAPHKGPKANKSKLIALIVGIAVVLLALGAGGWLLYRSSTNAAIAGGKYQAVFFTSGQVYFGKLQQINRDYFKLTDVFYIQAQSDANSSGNPQKASSDKNSDLQLIKLGNEVHGPDDEMIISKDQVLFFENLKQDGKVTESINKYLSQKK